MELIILHDGKHIDLQEKQTHKDVDGQVDAEAEHPPGGDASEVAQDVGEGEQGASDDEQTG